MPGDRTYLCDRTADAYFFVETAPVVRATGLSAGGHPAVDALSDPSSERQNCPSTNKNGSAADNSVANRLDFNIYVETMSLRTAVRASLSPSSGGWRPLLLYGVSFRDPSLAGAAGRSRRARFRPEQGPCPRGYSEGIRPRRGVGAEGEST